MKSLATFALLTPIPALAIQVEGGPEVGVRVFRQFSSYHSLEKGRRRDGPSLSGIVGSLAGCVEGFRYSDAKLNADIVWDEPDMAPFLANPRGFLPRTRMSFRGLPDAQHAADVTAHIAEQNQ